MTDTTEQEAKKKLALGKPGGRLEMKVETGQVRQSFSHGRTKTVQVEVKRKRTFTGAAAGGAKPAEPAAGETTARAPAADAAGAAQRKPAVLKALTAEERAARQHAIERARRGEVDARRDAELRRTEEERLRHEEAERLRAETEAKARAE